MFNNIKNFIYDQEYYISIYQDKIYLFNYELLPIFNDINIKVKFSDFFLLIKGTDLKVIKIENKEMIIKGKITNIEVHNE